MGIKRVSSRNMGKHARIIVRRVLAEPRATWAGGTPHASFAMFKVWMKRSNVVRTPSRPFDFWDEAIVENRGWYEMSAWVTDCEKESGRTRTLTLGRAAVSPRGSLLMEEFQVTVKTRPHTVDHSNRFMPMKTVLHRYHSLESSDRHQTIARELEISVREEECYVSRTPHWYL